MAETHIELRREVARLAGQVERKTGTSCSHLLKTAASAQDAGQLLSARDEAMRKLREHRDVRINIALGAVGMTLLVLACVVAIQNQIDREQRAAARISTSRP